MRAVQLRKFGGWQELYIGDVAQPERSAGEVLVKVYASALNRADLLQRQGKYPPPAGASEILGLEVAGVIVAADRGSKWKIGQRIMALLPGGGQAGYVAVPEYLLMPIPQHLSFVEAAGIPEVFLTAYQTIFFEGEAKENSSILIHAGASGVGTAAIQLAKQAGFDVYVTCSAKKHLTCLNLGAALAIDYRAEKFEERVLEETGNRGVDLILDFIGSPYFDANLKALAVGGRLMHIAMMGGAKLENANIAPILRKNLTLRGTTLRSRAPAYKASLIENFLSKYWSMLDSGAISPIIDSVYALDEIQLAHKKMEANENTGKIIIEIAKAD